MLIIVADWIEKCAIKTYIKNSTSIFGQFARAGIPGQIRGRDDLES